MLAFYFKEEYNYHTNQSEMLIAKNFSTNFAKKFAKPLNSRENYNFWH